MNKPAISAHDARELDAFRGLLQIVTWRMNALMESRTKAISEACLEVYGDKFGEGNKHHE